MSRLVYFDYRGTRPPTIQSSYREPYHYVVEVSKIESDGRERTRVELQKAASILIRDAFEEGFAETVISAPQKAEITREEFNRMETEKINRNILMPGGVYSVLSRRKRP